MCEQGEPRLEKSTMEAHPASELLRTPAKKMWGTCPVNASLVGKLLSSDLPQPVPLPGVQQQQSSGCCRKPSSFVPPASCSGAASSAWPAAALSITYSSQLSGLQVVSL